jgi:hypothetical protein
LTKSSVQRTVRFESAQYDVLVRSATKQRRSVSDLLRIIIDQHLASQKVIAESERRHLRMSEYAQAALDTIILEQHPEFRERIIAETERRMERYHGA